MKDLERTSYDVFLTAEDMGDNKSDPFEEAKRNHCLCEHPSPFRCIGYGIRAYLENHKVVRRPSQAYECALCSKAIFIPITPHSQQLKKPTKVS